jgi:hypothetical protein
MPSSRALVLAVLAAAIAAAAAVVAVPWSEPLYFHLDSAREWLATGRITDYHAIGYPLLLAGALAAGGPAAVLVLHAAILAAIAGAAAEILRTSGLGPRGQLAGALAVTLHPLLVVNVTKISDTNLTALLLLLFVLVLLRGRRDGLSPAATAASALLFTALLLVRPNLALLCPLVPLLAARGGAAPRPGRAVGLAAAAGGVAVLAAMGVNAAVTGPWRLADAHYAAYTFHNGTNPHAARHILRDTIGEYSTYRALEDEGIDAATTPRTELTDIYWRLGGEFIRDRPLDYAALLSVKVVNFFRPYYREGGRDRFGWVATAVQTAAALPVVVWAVLRWRARRRMRWRDGLLGLVVLPLYALPFVLTNTEPRYRWPLDVVLMLEALVIAVRYRRGPAW